MSLRVFPLAEHQYVHHLLHVSGVVVFRQDLDWDRWADYFLQSEKILAIPHEALIDEVFKDLFSLEKLGPNRFVILFEISEIENKISLLFDFARKNLPVIVLANKEVTSSQLSVLESVNKISKKLQVFFIENRNNPTDHLFETLPDWLKEEMSFVYLPKRNSADCLLSPEEVVDRIEFRKSQCEKNQIPFRLASFGADSVENPLLREFYESPSLERFLWLTRKDSHLRYFLLTLVRSSCLAGLLGFTFWLLKILLNPTAYNCSQELRGWGCRGLGWVQGLAIDLLMLTRKIRGGFLSICVRNFWALRRVLGRHWEVRVFVQAMMGQSWKLKVAFDRLNSNRWKLKVALGRLYSNRWKIKVNIKKSFGQHWRIKVALQKLIGQSWRVRVYFQYLWGQSWRIRVGLQRVLIWSKWKFVELRLGARNILFKIWWRYIDKYLSFLLFPFKKSYWFLRYQYRTRILKSERLDHEI